MNSKKRICIVGYPQLTPNYETAFKDPDYEIVLPLKESSVYDWNKPPFIFHALASSCDLLILPGGGDIDPSFFRQNNTASRNVDFILDHVQFSFLDAFIKIQKPIIGICKGMQLINVFFGGNLIQNLPDSSLNIHAYITKDRYHAILPAVPASIPPAFSWLSAFPKTLVVNSAHHQAISKIGKHLHPVHLAKDGIIETLCHSTLPIIGVQWHPERLYNNDSNLLTPLAQKLLYNYTSNSLV